ncbi:MAG: hypothetical protein FJ179_11700 [Gammaproteobacteria bacterium]|nr:hypothetical protein [Gammaproteobacteria bacterium]
MAAQDAEAEIEKIVVTGRRIITRTVSRTPVGATLNEMTLSYRISYDDLDLRSGARRSELERRVNDAALAAAPLISSGTVCVLAKQHRLARETFLDPTKLRGEALILLGYGGRTRARIEAAFSEAGVVPNVRIETHTIGSACGLAAKKIGIGIVNALLARPYLRNGLVALPFNPSLRHEYAFVTAATPGPTRLASEFLEHCRRWLATYDEAGQARSTARPSRTRRR